MHQYLPSCLKTFAGLWDLQKFQLSWHKFDAVACMCRVHWTQKQWTPALETAHGLDRAKHWRKGSHWRALIRKHAQLAADDRQLVDALSQDCKDCHVSPPRSSGPSCWKASHASMQGQPADECMTALKAAHSEGYVC